MALPLAGVVFVSMIKDAFEDYKRHRADDGENFAKTNRFNPETRKFEEAKWCDIHPGDICRVDSD